MHVKKFSNRHKGHISGWLNLRDLDEELVNDLPELGFIAFNQEVAVGTMFLRDIEGNYAMIDSAITNPKASPIVRDEAMDLLTDAILKEAKLLKIKKLLIFTRDPNVIARATNWGFSVNKDVFMSKIP